MLSFSYRIRKKYTIICIKMKISDVSDDIVLFD